MFLVVLFYLFVRFTLALSKMNLTVSFLMWFQQHEDHTGVCTMQGGTLFLYIFYHLLGYR